MNLEAPASRDRADEPRPTCPFCREPWTDVMLDQLDSMTDTASCACCAGPVAAAIHWPLPMPAADLCCTACGRAIYRKA